MEECFRRLLRAGLSGLAACQDWVCRLTPGYLCPEGPTPWRRSHRIWALYRIPDRDQAKLLLDGEFQLLPVLDQSGWTWVLLEVVLILLEESQVKN